MFLYITISLSDKNADEPLVELNKPGLGWTNGFSAAPRHKFASPARQEYNVIMCHVCSREDMFNKLHIQCNMTPSVGTPTCIR